MRILIIGAGTLGTQAAEALAATGNQVTLMDASARQLDRASARVPEVRLVHGDGCDIAAVESAGVLGADVIAALTGHDADNLVISLLAKRRWRVPQVVARVNEPGDRWLFGDAWGVDAAISAPDALVSLIEEATRSAPTVDLLRLRQAGLELLETTLGATSRVAGTPVANLALPEGLVVTTVIRAGEPLPPAGAGPLRAGDQLLLLSRSTGRAEIEALFHGHERADSGRTPDNAHETLGRSPGSP
jgi:trk system potassium uptake protein TrkA